MEPGEWHGPDQVRPFTSPGGLPSTSPGGSRALGEGNERRDGKTKRATLTLTRGDGAVRRHCLPWLGPHFWCFPPSKNLKNPM